MTNPIACGNSNSPIRTRRKWQKVREKRVNRLRLVLVLSLIGWEKGVSVNHEAYYCKTKVITLVSRNAHGILMNQSESKANPYSRHKARKKAREHVVVCFGFTSDGCRNGVSDNHEAYYCITKVITLSITMRTVIQMNQLEIKVTVRS